MTPFEKISFNNFAGLIGVISYYTVKITLEIISNRRQKTGANY